MLSGYCPLCTQSHKTDESLTGAKPDKSKTWRCIMKNIICSGENFGKDHDLIHEVFVASRGIGAGQEFWETLVNDKELFKAILLFVTRNKSMTSQRIARKIMGKNFFGIEEAIRYFGIKPTNEQLLALVRVPFNEDELREVKETHLLIALFPLSILDIRKKIDSKLFHQRPCHNEEIFAKDCGVVSWQLVRKTPIDKLVPKQWEKQKAFLGENNEVPSAQLLVYAIIGYYFLTGERLFEQTYVITSSFDSGGYRVAIIFGFRGLYISHHWNTNHGINLGISSVRKSNFMLF